MSNAASLSRRIFVQSTSAAAVSITALSAQRVIGANETINVALIGCGGRGTHDMTVFIRNGANVLAVCDADSSRMEKARETAGGEKVKMHKDFRDVLAMKDVDAVIIGTPDHWHALPFIEACKAGKDVYCEKPLCVFIYEGQMMVKAARKYNRVTQCGTQQHSGSHYKEAVKLIQDGHIGAVTKVLCWNFENDNGMGQAAITDPPQELDWDLWLGPAPKTPYFRQRSHGSFRSFWDYSGGVMTDWGTHHIDIIQWALRQDYPQAVSAEGGKYGPADCGETPDTMDAVMKYDGCNVHYSLRTNNAYYPVPNSPGRFYGYGTLFYGKKATMFLNRNFFEIYPEANEFGETIKPSTSEHSNNEGNLDDLHVQDFLAKIKTRERCNADVEICHRATSTPHLANIALRSGERVVWDGENERIINHPELNTWLKRPYRSPWELTV